MGEKGGLEGMAGLGGMTSIWVCSKGVCDQNCGCGK